MRLRNYLKCLARNPQNANGLPSLQSFHLEWLWTSLSNRTTGEVIEVADPASYTIAFSADGTTRGRADCNTFSGTYSQADGFSVTIEALTQDDCGAESMGVMYTDLLGIVVAGGMASADEFALETAGGEQRMMFANGGVAP